MTALTITNTDTPPNKITEPLDTLKQREIFFISYVLRSFCEGYQEYQEVHVKVGQEDQGYQAYQVSHGVPSDLLRLHP